MQYLDVVNLHPMVVITRKLSCPQRLIDNIDIIHYIPSIHHHEGNDLKPHSVLNH